MKARDGRKDNTTKSRLVKVVLGAALAALVIPTPSLATAGTGQCSGPGEVVTLPTLSVNLNADTKSIRRGRTVAVTAHVQRIRALRADQPPIDSMRTHLDRSWVIPIPSLAAEGVSVAVNLSVGKQNFYGLGTTDAEGTAQLSIRIPQSAPPGAADADSIATKSLASSGCLMVMEEGKSHSDNFIRIRK